MLLSNASQMTRVRSISNACLECSGITDMSQSSRSAAPRHHFTIGYIIMSEELCVRIRTGLLKNPIGNPAATRENQMTKFKGSEPGLSGRAPRQKPGRRRSRSFAPGPAPTIRKSSVGRPIGRRAPPSGRRPKQARECRKGATESSGGRTGGASCQTRGRAGRASGQGRRRSRGAAAGRAGRAGKGFGSRTQGGPRRAIRRPQEETDAGRVSRSPILGRTPSCPICEGLAKTSPPPA